jgi:hypothetical protein
MTIILCAGQNGRAVLVGDVPRRPVAGKPVTLKNARMVLYWDAACGGLLGLAANGPKGEDTRITHAVEETTETVWQEWTKVSTRAARELKKWPAC